MKALIKKAFFWSLYSLGIVIFFVCTAEFVLRVFNPLGSDYIYEARRYFKIMSRDQRYSYIHTPGVEDQFQGVHVRINSEGFRGKDFSVQKPPDTYRIVLLGDSVVFSWGVAEEQSLAVQLEKILETELDNTDLKIEVLPIGVGSWNTRTQYEFMVERGINYQPDLLVWIIVANDLEPKSRGRTSIPLEELREKPAELQLGRWEAATEELRRWIADYSHFWAVIERYRRLDYMRRLNQFYVATGSLQAVDARDATLQLASLLQAENIPIYAFIHGEQESKFGRAYHQLYGSFLDEANIAHFTFPEEVYDRKHVNSIIDPHQNGRGLAITARSIYESMGTLR